MTTVPAHGASGAPAEPDTGKRLVTRRGRRPAVYLHVGTPKSGTTYLQSLLWHNREPLRGQGVLYPGDTPSAHFLSTLDLQGADYRGHSYAEARSAWERLVHEVRCWSGTAVISHELLSRCTSEQAERALADLAFADVHLVLTTRDLARQITAAWQETVKNGFPVCFADYAAALREEHAAGDAHATAFWRMQDVPGVLGRWATGIPADRVHIVTVPRPGAGHDLLWSRFARSVGLDPACVPDATGEANSSLGAGETALLRRLNERLEGKIGWPDYEDVVKHVLVGRSLSGRTGSRRVVLDRDAHDWARERSTRMIEELRPRGHEIIGDLLELHPEPYEEAPDLPGPDEVSEEELVEPALDAMESLVLLAAERRRRADELLERLKENEQRLAAAERAFRTAYERPALRHLAHRVGHRVKPVMTLLEQSVRARDRWRGRRQETPEGGTR